MLESTIATIGRQKRSTTFAWLLILITGLLWLQAALILGGENTSLQITDLPNLSLNYVIFAFLILESLNYLGLLIPGIKEELFLGLENGYNTSRWINWSLTLPLMILSMSWMVGINNKWIWLMLLVATWNMVACGCLMEHLNHQRQKTVWWPIWIGGLQAGLIIGTLLRYLLFNPNSDIYWIQSRGSLLAATLMCTFFIFPILMIKHYRGHPFWRNREHLEIGFAMAAVFCKSLLAWQIYIWYLV